MRTLTLRLATVLVVLASAQAAFAQSADEIIEKSLAAMGGRAALEKIKTRVMTGTITLSTPAGNIPGTIEIYNAAPNKTRTVINADLTSLGAGPMKIDQRFDGTNGYILDSMQGDRPVGGDQLANMRANAFPHPFLNYKAMGTTVTLVGKEKAGDRDAYVINFQPTQGPPVRQFIDAETFMPLRASIKMTVPQLGELEQTSEASDFRDIDGVKVPFKVQVSSKVQGYTIVVAKVEQNVTLDDKMFVKP